MASDLKKKEQDRFRLLLKLYDETSGNQMAFVEYTQFADELRMTAEETESAIQYLVGQGLITRKTMGTISFEHRGVLEVEEAMGNPRKPTVHFPASINIINAQNMIGSQIQQNTQGSSQTIGTGLDKKSLEQLLAQIQTEVSKIPISADQKRDIEADVATIESQLLSSSPKAAIIKESLSSLKEFLIIAGADLASAVLHGYLVTHGML